MGDIDRDIARVGIGKRRETAYEQINHSKIPKTNIQPLQSIRKTRKTPTPGYLTRKYKEYKDDGHDFIIAGVIVILVVLAVIAKILHLI
jgi:hypothetical protein